jgi:pectin methylesterase-like acyl-CoA thioesterase
MIGISLGLASPAEAAMVVAADGSGDYTNLQAAVDAVPSSSPSPTKIFIKPGRYYGHVSIPANKSSIAFIGRGQAPTNTLITWSISSVGGKMENSTLSIFATNLSFENLTIENSLPVNSAQANAITSSGGAAFIQFTNVWILSTQDTIYMHGGPLYFDHCHIAGTVDFICGDGPAWFESTTLLFLDRGPNKGGILTANNSTENQPYGFVFNNCTITGAANTLGCSWLGRPWRPSASVTFLNCKMDRSINPEGWCPWKWPTPGADARFREYGTMNLDGSPKDLSERVGPAQNWRQTKVLTSQEAAACKLTDVLMGWTPPCTFQK